MGFRSGGRRQEHAVAARGFDSSPKFRRRFWAHRCQVLSAASGFGGPHCTSEVRGNVCVGHCRNSQQKHYEEEKRICPRSGDELRYQVEMRAVHGGASPGLFAKRHCWGKQGSMARPDGQAGVSPKD